MSLNDNLIVKPCLLSSRRISLPKKLSSTNRQTEDNEDVNNALTLANEIIETASLNVIKAAKELAVESEESKGSKHVNIPFDKIIYNDLVELYVNDQDLKNIKRVSNHRKSTLIKTEDATPCIHDYRTPRYEKPHVIKEKSEVPAKHMVRQYDCKEMHRLFNRIEGLR